MFLVESPSALAKIVPSIHGIFHGILPWNSMEKYNEKNAMEFHVKISWNSMEFNGIPLTFPWNSMEL
jgi:hypothetical protein